MERHRKGDLTEAIVIAELKQRNIPVSVPTGDNERYDIIVESSDGELLRVQVKTGRFVDGKIVFNGVSQHTNSKGSRYESYNDIDYFVVYCDEVESMFLVPGDEVGHTMALRIAAPLHDHPSINWAVDYRFDKNWPPGKRKPTTATCAELPTHRRGEATESKVISELLRREISLAVPPTDNERYDLLAGTPDGDYFWIQVKTGWIDDGRIQWKTYSNHTNSEGNVYKDYHGDIDYFLVYEPTSDELYLVAEDAFDASISLRVEEPKVIHRDMKWAEDYRFDDNWPPDDEITFNPIRRHPRDRVVRSTVKQRLREIEIPIADVESNETAYDFIAESPDGGFVRLAIRTAQRKDGRLFFHPEAEDEDQIDQYLLYCYDLDTVYLIGPDEFDASITLWVDDPKEIRRTTKWAEDFELDRRWPPTPGPLVPERSTVGMVASALREHGIDVAFPAEEGCPHDLLAALDSDEFTRIGVEPGWIWNGRIRLKPETKDGIDVFLPHCRENDTTYLIAADAFETSISLRVEPAKHDPGTINRAEEFELARSVAAAA